jgi:hypothetical protein
MSGKKRNISRRDFIKTAGVSGLGSTLIPFSALTLAHDSASANVPEEKRVPTRPFKKTPGRRCGD